MAVILVAVATTGSAYAFWASKKIPLKDRAHQRVTRSDENPPLIGGQRDDHGCLTPAGYSWCEQKQKCLRPWEEKCTPTSTLTAYLTFQPMQCEEEPWQAWYKKGDVKFFKAPTEEELVKTFYAQTYSINIKSVQKIDSDRMTCEACGVCQKSYSFSVGVADTDAAKLEKLGWKK